MAKRLFFGCSALAVLIFSITIHLAAQELATLSVTVTDQSGGVIPQARVTVRSTETGAKRSEASSGTGLVVIPGLPAGSYELTVEAGRFSSYRTPLTLTVGQVASLGVTLAIEGAKQQVEVRESAQSVDAEKSDVSQVIDTQKISDLPIAGRDFIDFVLLTPTANVGRSTAVGSQSPFTETVLQLSFGGLRETHSSFFGLDGVDYTTSISGVQRVSPSQDWVQEFRVVASPYTADYGRNLGSVVNTITKSGGNEIHGSIYDYFRNNVMDATNLLAAPGFNALRFDQYGADAGGPEAPLAAAQRAVVTFAGRDQTILDPQPQRAEPAPAPGGAGGRAQLGRVLLEAPLPRPQRRRVGQHLADVGLGAQGLEPQHERCPGRAGKRGEL